MGGEGGSEMIEWFTLIQITIIMVFVWEIYRIVKYGDKGKETHNDK